MTSEPLPIDEKGLARKPALVNHARAGHGPSGFDQGEEYIPFSTRDKVSRAIADPGLTHERLRTHDGLVETLAHWQARAAIEAMLQQAAKSPAFARAIAARQSPTPSPPITEKDER